MNICCITFVTPASENIRGTSALPYHLLKGATFSNSVDGSTIYTFNANRLSADKISEVEQELGVNIKTIPLPRWYGWLFKFHLLFVRIFLKYPFTNYIVLPQNYVDEIKAQNPDLIWVMGEEMSRIVKQFPGKQRIQIGPDTESLYYYRMMGRRFVMNNAKDYWKCALMYRKYARMEKELCCDDNYTFYAVGEEDVNHIRQLNPKLNAHFLRHPHYEVEKIGEKQELRQFHKAKIRLLIAGQYNLYMRQSADELVSSLSATSSTKSASTTDYIQKNYELTFLGKGWEKHVTTLRASGYDVNHITFTPDYIEEICKHDIQITPIAIGTGTKGKVLDALANGLLVIGTPYAMENIAVEHGRSCIVYRQPQEVMDVLVDIPTHREQYEKMAEEGRTCVLKYHDRKVIAQQLFGLIK